MTIIFFDLETSDKEFCGQILNYSFIRTDNSFQIEDELSGDIELSLLQIPSPEALLTNRVKILDHQASHFPREPESMQAITRFIGNSLEVSKDQVYLAGYNSTRFDLPFLRTSLIRNGLNPYFSGKLKYSDILHLVRKAYLSKPDFPPTYSASDPAKLSLSLEAVTRALGLLGGLQTHHSRDDVLLTIELCKLLQERFELHSSSFNAYEPASKENLIVSISPNYAPEEGKAGRLLERPVGLLNESHRAALWVDLERFKAGEGRASISWYNKNGGQLTKSTQASFPPESAAVLEEARNEFRTLTTDNFFTRSTCDIEQDIYRLDMQKITILSQIIWNNERSKLKQIEDKDLQQLVSRYWLAYGLAVDKRGEKWKEKLAQYAKYRYGGGEFQIPKSLPVAKENQESSGSSYHISLSEIKAALERLRQARTDVKDQEILRQLQEYIESSPVAASLAMSPILV